MRMAERVPFPEPALDDGIFYEVETEKILRIVRKLVDGSDCDDVYISTQMHGYFLADARSRLLTRYISWQDRRAGEAGDTARGFRGERHFYESEPCRVRESKRS